MKLGFYESEKWESNQSVYGEISDCLLKSNVKQKDLPVTEKPVKCKRCKRFFNNPFYICFFPLNLWSSSWNSPCLDFVDTVSSLGNFSHHFMDKCITGLAHFSSLLYHAI